MVAGLTIMKSGVMLISALHLMDVAGCNSAFQGEIWILYDYVGRRMQLSVV